MSNGPARGKRPESARQGALYPTWLLEALEMREDEQALLSGAAAKGAPTMDAAPKGARAKDGPAKGGSAKTAPAALNGEPAETADEAPRRRHLYLGFESSRVPPRGFRCRVMIQLDGHDYIGEATGPEIPGVRAEITARATLDALKKAEGQRIELALLGARVLRVFDRPVAIVGVYGLDDEVRPLIGASLVRESVEQATVLATLQATNRWIMWEVSRGNGQGKMPISS